MAAFEHEGPARALVHNLKYRGIIWYAEVVAEALAPRLPTIPLVPIPRAWSRQVGYGIDPSRQIASALARRLATPVLDLLRPPLHSKRRAGGDHGIMPRPFRLVRPPETKYQLVDDVVTTGATVMAAARSLGSEQLALVVAANAADRCLVSFK